MKIFLKISKWGYVATIIHSFVFHQVIAQDCLPLVGREWIATYSNQDSLFNTATAVDVNHNVYVAGYITSLSNGEDFVVIKYDIDGNRLWVRNYDGPANSNDRATGIAIDANCNVFVTGYSMGLGSNFDYATIKYDSTGNQQWVVRYNGPGNSIDAAKAIRVDNMGNIYITGFSGGVMSLNDYATIKYTTSGTIEWIQRFDSPHSNEDIASSLAVDQIGNVYINGRTLNNMGFFDLTTIRYNSASGALLWVNTISDSLASSALNSFNQQILRTDPILSDGARNIYLCSSLGSESNSDFFTLKLDSAGSIRWSHLFDGNNLFDAARDLAVDSQNNLYVTGPSQITATSGGYATISYDSSGALLWTNVFDTNLDIFQLKNGRANAVAASLHNTHSYITGQINTGANLDMLAISFDSEGHVLWLETFGGPGDPTGLLNNQFGADIVVDDKLNVYVVGQSYNGNNFDITTIKYHQEPEPGRDIQSILDITLFDDMLEFRNVPHFEQVIATIGEDGDDAVSVFEAAKDSIIVIRESVTGNFNVNKLESAISNLDFALEEAEDSLPSYQLILTKLKNAVKDVLSVVNNGGVSIEQGRYLLDQITYAAVVIINEAHEVARIHGGNSNLLLNAEGDIANGNVLRTSGNNGNLFDFENAMTSYMQALVKLRSMIPNSLRAEDDLMKHYEASRADFTSLQTIFEGIIDTATDADSLLVDSLEILDLIASLLNQNALIKVCDRVYKLDFSRDSVFALNVQQHDYFTYKESLINSVAIDTVIIGYSMSQDVFDTIYNPLHFNHAKEGRCPWRIYGPCEFKYSHDNKLYRFKGRIYYTNAGIYRELGVKVKHQRKRDLGWFKENAKNTYIDYIYTYKRRNKDWVSGDVPLNKRKDWNKKRKRAFRAYKGTRSLSYYSIPSGAFVGGKTLTNQDERCFLFPPDICDERDN